MTQPCRYPFAHEPHECDCRPSRIEIQVDRFEANAAFRQTMAERDGLYLAAVWAVAFIAALGFLVAADWGLTRAEREFQLQARV